MSTLLPVIIVLLFSNLALAQNPYFPLNSKVKYTYRQDGNPYSKITEVTTAYVASSSESKAEKFVFTIVEDSVRADTNSYRIMPDRIQAYEENTYFADIFEYNPVTDTTGFDMVTYQRVNTVTKLKEHTVLGKKYNDVICVRSQWITLKQQPATRGNKQKIRWSRQECPK
jgi:hypothetical protein